MKVSMLQGLSVTHSRLFHAPAANPRLMSSQVRTAAGFWLHGTLLNYTLVLDVRTDGALMGLPACERPASLVDEHAVVFPVSAGHHGTRRHSL